MNRTNCASAEKLPEFTHFTIVIDPTSFKIRIEMRGIKGYAQQSLRTSDRRGRSAVDGVSATIFSGVCDHVRRPEVCPGDVM